MKKIVILFFSLVLVIAGSKKFEKTFQLKNGDEIELNTISGMDVKISTWNKDEIMIKLRVTIGSVSREEEREYFENFRIEEDQFDSGKIITIEDDHENGSSFKIFGLEFGSGYIEKEIRGEIIIPQNSSLSTDLRYGSANIKDLSGKFRLKGRSNELIIDNCSDLAIINNEYGNISIFNSGGDLEIDTRSVDVEISKFDGNIDISADYSDVKITNVTNSVNLRGRSSDRTEISNIGGELKINSPYSNIFINNCEKQIDVINRSGNLDIKNIKSFWIEAPYSDCKIEHSVSKAESNSKIFCRSGEIKLFNIVGNIAIEDQYSDIELKYIEGNIEMTNRSGSIFGENIKGNWNSKTEYSDINLISLDSEVINITNRSENIYLDFINIPNSIIINNNYGGVEFRVPSNFSAEYDFTANYGSIKSDFQLKIKEVGSSEIAIGRLGNLNNIINCETRSGDIKLISK